jgi:Mrp family chromosome partitioning ATPase
LLITSSQPAEGKSTTSLAVARGIAKLGRRVVLLDVDLRRPALHAIDRRSQRTRHVHLLTRTTPSTTRLRSPYENLWVVLRARSAEPDRTAQLGTPSAVLRRMSQRFDVVILDSPPVLGLADAPLMSAIVDGVVLVVQSDRSRRGSLRGLAAPPAHDASQRAGRRAHDVRCIEDRNRYSEYYGYSYYQYVAKSDA